MVVRGEIKVQRMITSAIAADSPSPIERPSTGSRSAPPCIAHSQDGAPALPLQRSLCRRLALRDARRARSTFISQRSCDAGNLTCIVIRTGRSAPRLRYRVYLSPCVVVLSFGPCVFSLGTLLVFGQSANGCIPGRCDMERREGISPVIRDKQVRALALLILVPHAGLLVPIPMPILRTGRLFSAD